MAYIAQKTRLSRLTINGQDYTDSLISWSASDESAMFKGLVVTTGTMLIGQAPGGDDIKDYDRNFWKRGTLVKLYVTEPGGSEYKHPRGHLYIMSVAYDTERERLEVSLTCKLGLAYLTDTADNILPLVPIPLDPAQQTIQNCSASFASAGKFLFQDNNGGLVERSFFGNDNNGGIEAGAWVSVLGQTVLAASPLNGGDPIPDKVELSYNVPSEALAEQESAKIDTTEELSNYFLTYPAITYQRVPQEDDEDCPSDGAGNSTGMGCIAGSGIDEPPPAPDTTTSCGNAPEPPTTGPPVPEPDPEPEPEPVACNVGWETVPAPTFVPASKRAYTVTEYNGPAGQMSRTVSEVYGPRLEVNQQYYADKFAYCTNKFGYACSPNGNCPMDGLQISLQSRVITQNFFGEASELVKQIRTTYTTRLSAAQPFDWRAGVVNGRPRFFRELSGSLDLYRSQVVETRYFQGTNNNVQETDTYTSVSSRRVGLFNGNLDAKQGIKTSQRRISTTTATLEVSPDRVNSVTTATTERTKTFTLPGSRRTHTSIPSEAGPYVVKTSIPLPLLFTKTEDVNGVPTEVPDEGKISEVLNDYINYYGRFLRGDLFGYSITEALRSDLAIGYYPGRPFRYADPGNNQIMAMRMDACTWTVTATESIVTISGIWNGFSTGTLSAGSNVVGDSRPDMSGGGITPPPNVVSPPSVINDQVGQSFEFFVDVELNINVWAEVWGDEGVVPINPTDLTTKIDLGLIVITQGSVVGPGDLLESTASGGIPASAFGSLITVNADVIVPNLFV